MKQINDYKLLDSGECQKLEQYGEYTLVRPDPQALWNKKLSKEDWIKSDASFVRTGGNAKWMKKKTLPKSWNINFNNLVFQIRPTSFKHTGLFPEHIDSWIWMENKISFCIEKEKRIPNILNLFGYTGGASLSCAKAGAEVCHLDGSPVTIKWARTNAELSGLRDLPIRWIIDDARAFLRREIRRGKKYDGIVMDPPAFGHGPKGEVWKIDENFLELLDLAKQVLSDKPIFFVINGYASGYSALAYKNNLDEIFKDKKGSIETGELIIKENSNKRVLPCGIYARWGSV